MKKLGFSYEPRKKNYYVGGHEKQATVVYHWNFIERYLERERKMYRWIQVTETEAHELEDKNLSHVTAETNTIIQKVEKECGSIMLIPATFFKKG
jgi:hypothetical protein